jgi:hypothetical protein
VDAVTVARTVVLVVQAAVEHLIAARQVVVTLEVIRQSKDKTVELAAEHSQARVAVVIQAQEQIHLIQALAAAEAVAHLTRLVVLL